MAASPRSYCYALLKRRLYSRFELDQAMKRRGFEDGDRQEALAHLAEIGLVDDLRFARAWVHTRDLLSPRGAAVLRQELVSKGIANEVVSEVLGVRRHEAEDENNDQPTEEDLAREVVRSRERQYRHLDPEIRKRRMMGTLMRRGFSYDTIRRIL